MSVTAKVQVGDMVVDVEGDPEEVAVCIELINSATLLDQRTYLYVRISWYLQSLPPPHLHSLQSIMMALYGRSISSRTDTPKNRSLYEKTRSDLTKARQLFGRRSGSWVEAGTLEGRDRREKWYKFEPRR